MTWWDRLYNEHADLWARVVAVLTLCEKHGLKWKKQDLDDNETVALYVQDCLDARLTVRMVESAAHYVRTTADHFPDPSQFARLVGEYVSIEWFNYSYEAESEDGPRWSIERIDPKSPKGLEMTARREAYHKGLPYGDESQKALPVTKEQRSQLVTRLKNLPVGKRMSEPRARSQKDEEPDPEFEAEQKKQIGRVREEV